MLNNCQNLSSFKSRIVGKRVIGECGKLKLNNLQKISVSKMLDRSILHFAKNHKLNFFKAFRVKFLSVRGNFACSEKSWKKVCFRKCKVSLKDLGQIWSSLLKTRTRNLIPKSGFFFKIGIFLLSKSALFWGILRFYIGLFESALF